MWKTFLEEAKAEWSELGDLFLERLFKPSSRPAALVYIGLPVGGFGGVGLWVTELLAQFGKAGPRDLSFGLGTYALAIVATSRGRAVTDDSAKKDAHLRASNRTRRRRTAARWAPRPACRPLARGERPVTDDSAKKDARLRASNPTRRRRTAARWAPRPACRPLARRWRRRLPARRARCDDLAPERPRSDARSPGGSNGPGGFCRLIGDGYDGGPAARGARRSIHAASP